jgi:hypothetical protein
MGNLRRFQTAKGIEESWISGHLYYHQSLDPAVIGFVHPLVAALVKDGQIGAFFFVRYALGGPHIRVRLRVISGTRERVIEVMQRSAQRFLEFAPSIRSMDEEAIRRTNESILAGDPNEDDDSVYPDNSFRMTLFHPEIQRYGGPRRFLVSLDFFTLSSVAAIEFLSKYEGTSRSAQLTNAFRLLLQQALGFAIDEVELFDILGYGVDWWGEALPKVVEKGSRVALSQIDAFHQILRTSLDEVLYLCAKSESLARGLDFLVVGASMLSAAIGADDRVARARIGRSQLHMTATRLGLSNAEEVYISRLLTVTLLEAAGVVDHSWLKERTVEEDPEEALGHLLPPALAVLTEMTTNQRAL